MGFVFQSCFIESVSIYSQGGEHYRYSVCSKSLKIISFHTLRHEDNSPLYEQRVDAGVDPDVTLKIWNYDGSNSRLPFSLSSRCSTKEPRVVDRRRMVATMSDRNRYVATRMYDFTTLCTLKTYNYTCRTSCAIFNHSVYCFHSFSLFAQSILTTIRIAS